MIFSPDDPAPPPIQGPNWEDELPAVINCRCLPFPVKPNLDLEIATPSPALDRFIRDLSWEWRAQAWIKAFAIDALPKRARR